MVDKYLTVYDEGVHVGVYVCAYIFEQYYLNALVFYTSAAKHHYFLRDFVHQCFIIKKVSTTINLICTYYITWKNLENHKICNI